MVGAQQPGETLKGKRVLVTGAARRIGRGLALALAGEGADVVITSREVTGTAEAMVKILQGLGVRAAAVACDVRKPESVRGAVTAAVAFLGGLDLLVNNAGAFETAALETMTPAQWDAMFETNTRGPFLMAQAAYPVLKAAKGRIVNIGSLGGEARMDDACSLLHQQGGSAHAEPDDGEGVGARSHGELRCAGDDCDGRVGELGV